MSAENRRLTPEEEAAELAKPGSHPEWEIDLPAAIQKDIDAYLEGIRTQVTYLDCLWDELYGSINASQWGWEISKEQADYLRAKYLFEPEDELRLFKATGFQFGELILFGGQEGESEVGRQDFVHRLFGAETQFILHHDRFHEEKDKCDDRNDGKHGQIRQPRGMERTVIAQKIAHREPEDAGELDGDALPDGEGFGIDIPDARARPFRPFGGKAAQTCAQPPRGGPDACGKGGNGGGKTAENGAQKGARLFGPFRKCGTGHGGAKTGRLAGGEGRA